MSSGQLRDVRTSLLLGPIAIERRLSVPSDDVAASPADHLACLTPVLDGLGSRCHPCILRRLVPDRIDPEAVARGPGIEVGVIVDVETTGLDHRRDEVIELGLVRFEHVEGQVLRVTGAFGALREPAELRHATRRWTMVDLFAREVDDLIELSKTPSQKDRKEAIGQQLDISLANAARPLPLQQTLAFDPK